MEKDSEFSLFQKSISKEHNDINTSIFVYPNGEMLNQINHTLVNRRSHKKHNVKI